jgi:outer membrane protein assembly factor BamB
MGHMKNSSLTQLGFPYLLLFCVLLLCASGCSKSDESSEAPHADLNRLRSLPYAVSSPAKQNEPDGVVFHDVERSSPGYNLYTVFALGTTELMDAGGQVVRSWSRPGETWMHGELLPNGDLLVVGAGAVTDGGEGQTSHIDDSTRFVQRFDWNGELIWKKPYLAHHDIEAAPGGKLLLLGLEYGILKPFDPVNVIRDDRLILLEPDGSIFGSFSLMEAIGRNDEAFPLYRLDPTEESGRKFIDILHANSVEWVQQADLVGTHALYDPANILVCFRHQNRVAVINSRAREVIWSWGRDELYGPHDAQMLADGNILVFDNGLGEKRSRIVELDPRRDEIVWQYIADPPGSFYTLSKGSAQRLPNGNTLAAESDKGRAFEITPDGEIVWEYLCPHFVGDANRAAIVRIKRFPVAFIEGIEALDDGRAD